MEYSDILRAKIDALWATIEGHTVAMAVVDYLGRQHWSHGFGFTVVKEDDPERFGVRDLRHVELYGFAVVRTNL